MASKFPVIFAPENRVETLPRKGSPKFVSWQNVKAMLDEHYPEWSGGPVLFNYEGDMAVVVYEMTIDGVSRSEVGTEPTRGKRQDGGMYDDENAMESASRKGFKRAAAAFNVGLLRDGKYTPLNAPSNGAVAKGAVAGGGVAGGAARGALGGVAPRGNATRENAPRENAPRENAPRGAAMGAGRSVGRGQPAGGPDGIPV